MDFQNDRPRGGNGGYGKGRPQGGGSRNGKGGFDGRKGGGPRGGKRFDDRRGDSHGGRRFDDRKGDSHGGPRGGRPFDRDRDGGNRRFGGDRFGSKRADGDRGPRSFDRDGGFAGAPQRARLHVDRGDRGPRGPKGAFMPLVGDSDLLKDKIERISGKSFGTYREIQGTFAFDGFELRIDRVQKDPFAPPSKLTLAVDRETAGFPSELHDEPWRRVALEDRVLREFNKALARHAFDFPEFIKGGSFSTSRPGAEVLKRSACDVSEDGVAMRFEATLPARERSIAAMEFEEMFFTALPRIVRESLLYVSYDAADLEAVANLADDQHAIREELRKRDLVCFVADGACLPRETGVSARPMDGAVPFESPESLRVELDLPHAGKMTGMGIPRGVTLIVGGGYHGKSTLLAAIQAGVYDHIAGDGREHVVCDASAMKLRAEDGRCVRGTDISLFINNLPNGTDTASFWTEDASGSTSQAASTAEALEAGVRTFLIDEDTCATNFMVRDAVMQAVVSPDSEPITPFVERLRDLYEKAGVSTILVAGSSGAFFAVADTVIQMKAYLPSDITAEAKRISKEMGAPEAKRAEGFRLPDADRIISPVQRPLVVKTASEARKEDKAYRESNKRRAPERLNAKVFGGVDIRVGTLGSDMRFVEQLADAEQTKALAAIVRTCLENDLFSRSSVKEVVARIMADMDEKGFAAIADTRELECGMAMPRREEVFACINRLRHRD